MDPADPDLYDCNTARRSNLLLCSFQNVYSENRVKATQSHAALEKFSAGNELPLYNQPSDTEVYNINKKK
jgi:hypothetical protein